MDFDRLAREAEKISSVLENSTRALRDNQFLIDRAMHDLARSSIARDLLQQPAWIEQLSKDAEAAAQAYALMATPQTLALMSSYTESQRRHADALQGAIKGMARFDEDLLAGMRSASIFTLAARDTLKFIDFDVLKPPFVLATQELNRLQRTTLTLCSRYSSLAVDLTSSPNVISGLPPFVSEIPAIDLFVHSESVRSVAPAEPHGDSRPVRPLALQKTVTDETDAFLEITLVRLKPAYLDQLHGFAERGEDRGPDWWGQAAESGRKLLLGVLHTAAPDALVLPWVTNAKEQLDRNGHPTRATKVAWLCQFIPNKAYRQFVRADLQSALALLDVMDAAVHVDEFPEFEAMFGWTALRLKVALRHILTIWSSRPTGN